MRTKVQMRRGFTLVELLVVIAIIAALAGFAVPAILGAKKKADQTEAINNARQIGIALAQFQENYGSNPSTTTAAAISSEGNTDVQSGASANALLSQLLATRTLEGKAVFYVKATGVLKVSQTAQDSNMRQLAAGQCGFGYVTIDASTGISSANNGAYPVLVTPFKALNNADFDNAPFNGEVVVLRNDSSVQKYKLSSQDNTLKFNGQNYLSRTAYDSTDSGQLNLNLPN